MMPRSTAGTMPAARSVLLGAIGLSAACTVAIANAAGYRFGVSDQEFYIPAIYLALDPSLFPHDRALIEAQGPFLAFDEIMAALTRGAGIDLPFLFFGGYVLTLVCLLGGAWLVGVRLYASRWAAGALVAALTLRHQIPGTAINTFEGYLHPRTLAFGIGIVAIAIFLRGRAVAALLAVAGAALMHPTTAAWFGMWLFAAMLASRRLSRRDMVVLAASAATASTLLVLLVLERGVQPMSPAWTAAATRRYIFFGDWPVWTWFAHAAAVAVATIGYRRRAAAGLVDPAERGMFMGAFALLAFLALMVPLVEARIPLAVQLQPGRVLWIWDFLATVYLVSLLAETSSTVSQARTRIVSAAIIVMACTRGAYIMGWEFPDRSFARVQLPGGVWGQVIGWAGTTPVGSNFLVDPGHAWRYGVSVRIGARRDVFLEATKDPALATYSEAGAIRVATRTRDLGTFASLDATRARTLASRYDLDYLIAEHPIDLPVVREFGPHRIYRLRDD